MVNIMANNDEEIIVDKQGRMVLPSRLRERLGVKKGGKVSVRLQDSSRIVIERRSGEDVQERVKNWVSASSDAKELVGTISGKKPMIGKWMSSEYARRKLGL
jgi:AbrB family looped-hinge helix DNA binding protein